MATDERGFEHGGRERVLGELRQEREALRALAPAPGRKVAAVEFDGAGGWRAKFGDR